MRRAGEMESHSVLITSVSAKVPMVTAVSTALSKLASNGRVFGADTNEACLGRHFVDGFWTMPRDDQLLVDDVVTWCRANDVRVVFPSRDGELPFWAAHRDVLHDNGISVMVSDADTVNVCLDKLAFYRQCETLGYPAIFTSEDCNRTAGELLVVKERFGARADNIGIRLTNDQAMRHAKSLTAPVFQPFVSGDEISADLYVSLGSDVKGVVLRRRNMVVNGESQVTTTFRDESLELLCAEMARGLKLRGHAMLQIIIDETSKPHVIECNCRFGGASTLGVEAGLDSFYWFVLESMGSDLSDKAVALADMPLRQIRYAADKVVPA